MNGTIGVIERYKEFLPVSAQTPMITMGEGSTPLVKSTNIGPSIGCENLYFKLEGCNPTGSFKDRGMVMLSPKHWKPEDDESYVHQPATPAHPPPHTAPGTTCRLSSSSLLAK